MDKRSSDESHRSLSDDEEISKYVTEFREEVEAKFRRSAVNAAFRFPRKPDRTASRKNLKSGSFDSLEGVSFYDLDSQNAKRSLAGLLSSRRTSEASTLVAVIKGLSRLDDRYLRSQFQSGESAFFRMLCQAVQRRAARDPKAKDSLNSCSVKTKQLFGNERQGRPRLSRIDERSVSLQRHFLAPETATNRLKETPDAKAPSNRPNKSLLPKPPSRADCSLKPLKSEKQLPKATASLARSRTLKTSALNSSSQANRHETASVFQAVKSAFVQTRQSNSNNKSGSRLKTQRPPPEPKAAQLKGQVSLTKQQLKSLIQRNIYRGPTAENERAQNGRQQALDSGEAKRAVALDLRALKERLGMRTGRGEG